MSQRFSVLGLVVVAAALDAGRKTVAANIAKGYNDAKAGEPGFWTWESQFAETVAALGVTFPSNDTARETGRLYGSAMRGIVPNGAARWAKVKADAETVDLCIGMVAAACAIHGARAASKSVATELPAETVAASPAKK